MADHSTNTGRLVLNNTVYDFAKETATVYLPAIAALYVGLATLWGLPNPTAVAGTIALVITFLGAVLKISTASYNNGKLDNPDNTKVATTELGE